MNGAHIDGSEGFVRAQDDSVQHIVAFTMALLASGVVFETSWQAAVGLRTHMLL